MRITSKGQVTIPKRLRQEFGLLAHTEVEFVADDKGVRIVKKKSHRDRSHRQRALQALRGSATVSMSTEDIMALTRDADHSDS